jgi:hypothetical protein
MPFLQSCNVQRVLGRQAGISPDAATSTAMQGLRDAHGVTALSGSRSRVSQSERIQEPGRGEVRLSAGQWIARVSMRKDGICESSPVGVSICDYTEWLR